MCNEDPGPAYRQEAILSFRDVSRANRPRCPFSTALLCGLPQVIVHDECFLRRVTTDGFEVPDRDRDRVQLSGTMRLCVRPDGSDNSRCFTSRGQLKQASNHAGNPFPPLSFNFELFLTGLGYGIELRLAVVFRCTPDGFDPFSLYQTDQTQVNCALVYGKSIFAHLLDPTRYAIPVHRTHRGQSLQHH